MQIADRIAHARQFLDFVFSPDETMELRAFTPGGKISGRYADHAKMAQHAISLQDRHSAKAIYFGLNALKPFAYVGAKQINTMLRRSIKGAGASDTDILHRTVYVIDVDSTRPKDVCATDAERDAAMAVAINVRAYLTSLGWPEPIIADSGNGVHLYYRGDRCNAASPAWVYILTQLNHMFATAGASVDKSVGNPSRILRLPGSMNCKGGNTPERPHRICHVLSYPAKWIAVEHGPMVSRLATSLGYSTLDVRPASTTKGNEEDVLALIEEYPEILTHDDTFDRGGKLIITLDECPFLGRPHGGGDSAFTVWKDGSVHFNCFADECPGHGFKSLLRMLIDRTGRHSEIFPLHDSPLTEREAEAWGMTLDELCTDAPLGPPERISTWGIAPTPITQHEPKEPVEPVVVTISAPAVVVANDPDRIYDAQTAAIMASTDWASYSTDPAEWGLTIEDVSQAWSDQATHDCDAAPAEGLPALYARAAPISWYRDPIGMGAWLGAAALFDLSRRKQVGRLDTRSRPMSEHAFLYLGALGAAKSAA